VKVLDLTVNVARAAFGRVSVVMMARTASSADGVPERTSSAISLMPRPKAGRGKCRPMTPVEATKTSLERIPNRAANSLAVQTVSAIPCLPVQALAHPELMMTTRAEAAFLSFF
jgi:hypothetical protein